VCIDDDFIDISHYYIFI